MWRTLVVLIAIGTTPACYSIEDPSWFDTDTTPDDYPYPSSSTDDTSINPDTQGWGNGLDTALNNPTMNGIDITGYTANVSFCDDQVKLTLVPTLTRCVVSLNITSDPNHVFRTEAVRFFIDGAPVNYDPNCTQGTGWEFYNNDPSQIRFCDIVCNRVFQANFQSVSMDIGCNDPVTLTI